MSKDNSNVIHVVEVDTRPYGYSSDIQGYKQKTCNRKFWQKNIVGNPRINMIPCAVAQECGLNIKMYVAKRKKWLAPYYRAGGVAAMEAAMIAAGSGMLSSNNGAATLLNIELMTGLAEWMVCGKAYIVRDDGDYPLSEGQVWGLQEMVNCAMDVYDFEPENMRRGHALLQEWTRAYRMQSWIPHSGTGGVDIYEPKA